MFKPLTSMLGDISFLHDFGSVAHLVQNPLPILFILANNQGGGIFNLLPVKDDPSIIDHLVTPHTFKFQKILSTFGIEALTIDSKEALESAIIEWQSNPRLLFLEVLLEDGNNQLLYKNLNTMSF